jgi:hypothetical protein
VAEFHVRGAADEKTPLETVGSEMRPLIGMTGQPASARFAEEYARRFAAAQRQSRMSLTCR